MAGTGIAPHVNVGQAALIVDEYASNDSPLRRVMPHVQAAGIARSIAEQGFADEVVGGWTALMLVAERWLVQRYVREDFCGLCARSTDHRGEH